MELNINDIKNIYKLLNYYCQKVEELEEKVSHLEGKKCKIIELKPIRTQETQ